jgi:hypothetical protein
VWTVGAVQEGARHGHKTCIEQKHVTSNLLMAWHVARVQD